MFIGSIEVQNIDKNKNNYTILDDEHTYHTVLINSFDLPYKTKFYATNVSSLEDFIKTNIFSIYTANKMLISIYNQLSAILSHNLSISFIDITDIIVIDSHQFFFCNTSKIFPVFNKTIKMDNIYDIHNRFLPPEFKTNTSIPFICNESSFIYSLALITLYSLKQTNNVFSLCSNDEVLDYYKSTKLYSILKLCLSDKPQNRIFLIF
jgi:hypothetical protein